MLKSFFILLFITLLLPNLSAQTTLNLTKEEMIYLQSKKNIKVHVEKDWAPFNFIKDDKAVGFANDYIRLIGKKLNTNIDFVQGYTWKQYMQMLKDGEIDLISTTTITDKRKESYIFSEKQLIDVFISLVTLKNNNLTLEQLDGKKLAVVKGYHSSEILEKYYPKIELVKVDSNLDLLKLLLNKEVNASLGNFAVLNYLINKNFFTNLINTPIIENEHFQVVGQYVSFNKNNTILKNIIDKAMLSITENELNEIRNIWAFNTNQTNILDNKLTDKEKEYLNNKKELTVCINRNNLPYESIENGKHIGISAEFITKVFENINIPLKTLAPNTPKELVGLLQNKKCDIKSTYIASKLPLKYNFTKPYLEDSMSLVTKIHEPYIKKFKQHLDKKFVMIANQRGPYMHIKKSFPNINIVFAKTIKEALKMVVDEKVFGYIGRTLISTYNIQKYYPKALKIMKEFNGTSISIGVIEDDKILLSILNKAIDSIDEKEKIAIKNNWISTTIEKELDYTFTWYILALIIVVLFTFLYKQYLLQKRIKDSKELIDATMEAIILHKNGKIIDVNKSALDMFGFDSKEEFNGNNILNQVAPESVELVKRKMSLENTNSYEIALFKQDGTKFYGLVHGKDIYNGQLRLASVIDITILKEQEKLIAQQAKMASMGEMIGNIAHQWRQPLSVISTSASGILYAKKFDSLKEEQEDELLNNIINSTEYLSNTIDTFRDFLKDEKELKEVILQERISTAIAVVESSLKNNHIKLINNINTIEPIKMKLIVGELPEVILNIVYNSKDALIEHNIDEPFVKIDLEQQNDKVVIKIEDNGGGIPDDVMPKIFEPYFTTKHQSIGTGLGLHMSYKIITESMYGKLYAKNTNDGVIFYIELPLSTN